jgi:predicted nucleotidyltransferase
VDARLRARMPLGVLPTMPTLRPRDFVECDGLLAAVISVVHPEGPAVTPRYVREGASLRKLDTSAARAFVVARHPEWLVHSPLLGVEVVLVPTAAVERVHRPEERAASLRAGEARHPIEQRARRVLASLVDHGVPPARLGVTGSLLVGAIHAASDIDVVTYGRSAFAVARTALGSLVASGRWAAPSADHWHDAWQRRGAPGALDDYIRHERRKGTKAIVDGVRLDLSLLQDDDEGTAEAPPYRKLGRLALEARIADASGAFDYPARYVVAHPDVPVLVSYTATYAGQARTGESVRAAGWLEQDATGARRLLIGTSREAPGEALTVIAHDA